MHVDEAGGDYEAGPIDNAPRPGFVQAANGLDLAVIDPPGRLYVEACRFRR